MEFLIILGGIAFACVVLVGLAKLKTGGRRDGESEAEYYARQAQDASDVFDEYNKRIEDYNAVPSYAELQEAERTVRAYKSAGVDLKNLKK